MRRISVSAFIVIVALTAACSKKVAAVKPSTPSAPVASTPSNDAPKPVAVKERPANNQPQQNTPRDTNARITPQERAALNTALARMEDAMFDYDKSTIRSDAAKVLGDDVAVIRDTLAKYPGEKITIEGHCDQRGSDEYNLALGERRAAASKEFLVNMGINGGQLSTISYGKERPQCTDDSEECYQRNRRAHLLSEAR